MNYEDTYTITGGPFAGWRAYVTTRKGKSSVGRWEGYLTKRGAIRACKNHYSMMQALAMERQTIHLGSNPYNRKLRR